MIFFGLMIFCNLLSIKSTKIYEIFRFIYFWSLALYLHYILESQFLLNYVEIVIDFARKFERSRALGAARE